MRRLPLVQAGIRGLTSMRPGQETPDEEPPDHRWGVGDCSTSMRPGQETPDEHLPLDWRRRLAGTSMRPGQETPDEGP